MSMNCEAPVQPNAGAELPYGTWLLATGSDFRPFEDYGRRGYGAPGRGEGDNMQRGGRGHDPHSRGREPRDAHEDDPGPGSTGTQQIVETVGEAFEKVVTVRENNRVQEGPVGDDMGDELDKEQTRKIEEIRKAKTGTEITPHPPIINPFAQLGSGVQTTAVTEKIQLFTAKAEAKNKAVISKELRQGPRHFKTFRNTEKTLSPAKRKPTEFDSDLQTIEMTDKISDNKKNKGSGTKSAAPTVIGSEKMVEDTQMQEETPDEKEKEEVVTMPTKSELAAAALQPRTSQ